MPQLTAAPPTAAATTNGQTSERDTRAGLLYGLGAYVWWGMSALYFRQLPNVPPPVILCHRFVGSVVLLGLMIVVFKRTRQLREAIAKRRLLAWLLLTGLLITCNWLVYIYAISTHRLVDASLGYFINPLFTIVLGMVFLRERLTVAQWAAVLLAFCGIIYLTAAQGSLPWIAASLPATFGFYSLIRKRTPVDPLNGLFIETAFLSPLAFAYLCWAHSRPDAAALNTPHNLAVLTLAGAVTIAPLIWFVAAAKRLPMVTLGFMQFLNPTLQFLTAVLLFGEPFRSEKVTAFAFIWLAVVLFLIDSAWRAHRARVNRA